ncbi:MAG: DUF2905 family protein [Bacteroidota bacterium]|nr:DUF2905 family protein [Bacteroidota bacterium]
MDPQFQPLGKLIIILGVIIILIGVVVVFWGKIPFLGKLPVDIYIKKDNYSLYIPLASSILLSIIISIIMYFFRK